MFLLGNSSAITLSFHLLLFLSLTDVFQSPTSTLQKDESIIRVVVRIPNQQVFKDVCITISEWLLRHGFLKHVIDFHGLTINVL